MSGPPGIADDDRLDDFVDILKPDQQRSEKTRERALPSNESDSDEDSSDSVSTVTIVESSPYEVPIYEAHHYYAGVSPNGRGPKLVYRTSSDIFKEPSGPEAYGRLMRMDAVPGDHGFGAVVKWETVRDGAVNLLDRRNIKVTSVDFVRFSWPIKESDQEIHEDEDEDEDNEEDNEDNEDSEDGKYDYNRLPIIQTRHVTNPTIWIGVLPDTLTATAAHESAKDIRAFLDELQVQDIDIAFRESTYNLLHGHGPALFPPVDQDNVLEKFISNVSVTLGLPIAGLKTAMQGTLGPYFHVDKKLYAITARHNLLLLDGDNDEYEYHGSGPKKEVVVMGEEAFKGYLDSICAWMKTLEYSADILQRRIDTLTRMVADGINITQSQASLEENKAELARQQTRIATLRNFKVDMDKNWSKPKDRVIGFVSWAPPIGLGVPPHRYTRDLCVVELYKDKFKHMIGNVLSLGSEYQPFEIMSLLHDGVDIASEIKYPEEGLLPLQGMLSAEQVNNPNHLHLQGKNICRVLKRGPTTQLTVGTLTGFRSFVRRYSLAGNMESLELPILLHEKESGTFSKGGDSGSLIVSAHGEFVGLLSGGSGSGSDGSDITYATLFEWVWELVCAKFPSASLYFNDLKAPVIPQTSPTARLLLAGGRTN